MYQEVILPNLKKGKKVHNELRLKKLKVYVQMIIQKTENAVKY